MKTPSHTHLRGSIRASNPTAQTLAEAYIETLFDEVVIIGAASTNASRVGAEVFDVSPGLDLELILDAISQEFPGILKARFVSAYFKEDGTVRWVFEMPKTIAGFNYPISHYGLSNGDFVSHR